MGTVACLRKAGVLAQVELLAAEASAPSGPRSTPPILACGFSSSATPAQSSWCTLVTRASLVCISFFVGGWRAWDWSEETLNTVRALSHHSLLLLEDSCPFEKSR